MEIEGTAAEAAPAVVLCSVCKKEFSREHQQDADCELADAQPNEHKMTRGELRLYKPAHQVLVLTYGPIKFAFAFNVKTSNEACNHWSQIAGKYMHMRPATQRMIANYDWVLTQALDAHDWTLADILPIVEELIKAENEQGPKLIIPN